MQVSQDWFIFSPYPTIVIRELTTKKSDSTMDEFREGGGLYKCCRVFKKPKTKLGGVRVDDRKY